MEMNAEEFLTKAGLDEPLAPGQLKLRKHVGKNPSTSFTVVYDWKTDPNKIRVELRAGLTGEMPGKKELGKYALWLQSINFMELDVSETMKHMTKH